CPNPTSASVGSEKRKKNTRLLPIASEIVKCCPYTLADLHCWERLKHEHGNLRDPHEEVSIMPSWKGWAVLSMALYLPSAANVAAPSQSVNSSVATGDPASVVKEVFMVPTRDGVLLKTILFRLPSVKGPGPVVLLRAPLNQERYEAQARPFA